MTASPLDNPIDLTNIFLYVDQHRQEFLERLIDYVRRPSISAYGEGIGEVAGYIANIMTQPGLQTRMRRERACKGQHSAR